MVKIDGIILFRSMSTAGLDYTHAVLRENAKKLIEEVLLKYTSGMKSKSYVNLVYRCAKKLNLDKKYCKVTFSYLASKRKKKGAPIQKTFADVFPYFLIP